MRGRFFRHKLDRALREVDATPEQRAEIRTVFHELRRKGAGERAELPSRKVPDRRRPDYDGLESASDAAKASSPVRPVLVELMESEIGIGVDADGSLVRVGPGNHRMAIARQLGLARVPVELRLFHAAWVRRQMAQGKGPLQSITAGVRRIGAKQQRNISGDHP